MSDHFVERWNASSRYAVIALGIAGAVRARQPAVHRSDRTGGRVLVDVSARAAHKACCTLWLAWFSFVASLAHFVMTFGLIVESGPLVPGEVMTYALYTIALLWLIATTTLMVFGVRRRPHPDSAGGTR